MDLIITTAFAFSYLKKPRFIDRTTYNYGSSVKRRIFVIMITFRCEEQRLGTAKQSNSFRMRSLKVSVRCISGPNFVFFSFYFEFRQFLERSLYPFTTSNLSILIGDRDSSCFALRLPFVPYPYLYRRF